MTMSKRGHSNLYANEAQPHPGNASIAIIRISGGASPYTIKDLPPLSLSRDEWQTIGERMGWTKYRLSADKEQLSNRVRSLCRLG